MEPAVVVVCSDVSSNCLGRALLLAELAEQLGRRAEVVGFTLGEKLWPPALSSTIPILAQSLSRSTRYISAAGWLRHKLLGKHVVVSKPRMTSLGLALLAGVTPSSLLLDNDDWEVGFTPFNQAPWGTPEVWGREAYRLLFRPHHRNDALSTKLLELVAHRSPHCTVSNRWLQRRFGGTLVPHVRDTEQLDPARVNVAAVRAQLEMDGRIWVGFIGTIRPHKGVEQLLQAVSLTDNLGLYLAGIDLEDPYVIQLVANAKHLLGAARVRLVPSFDAVELPKWVAAPDIICIPSRDDPAAIGQIPAKLFDAMAMAKPVVVTAVNDMPEILGQAGLTVEPDHPQALSVVLQELADDPNRRKELGEAARARACETYSRASAAAVLEAELSRLPVFLGTPFRKHVTIL